MDRKTVNLPDEMEARLGVLPKIGKKLIAAGYVTIDGQPAQDPKLPRSQATGKMLSVLGRGFRLVGSRRAVEDEQLVLEVA